MPAGGEKRWRGRGGQVLRNRYRDQHVPARRSGFGGVAGCSNINNCEPRQLAQAHQVPAW